MYVIYMKKYTQVSCIAGRCFTIWTIRKAPKWKCQSLSHIRLLGPHGPKPSKLLCPWNSPGNILKWISIPFSRGSSPPGDKTLVFCTAGRFFTIWATRRDHKCVCVCGCVCVCVYIYDLYLEYFILKTSYKAIIKRQSNFKKGGNT